MNRRKRVACNFASLCAHPNRQVSRPGIGESAARQMINAAPADPRGIKAFQLQSPIIEAPEIRGQPIMADGIRQARLIQEAIENPCRPTK